MIDLTKGILDPHMMDKVHALQAADEIRSYYQCSIGEKLSSDKIDFLAKEASDNVMKRTGAKPTYRNSDDFLNKGPTFDISVSDTPFPPNFQDNSFDARKERGDSFNNALKSAGLKQTWEFD